MEKLISLSSYLNSFDTSCQHFYLEDPFRNNLDFSMKINEAIKLFVTPANVIKFYKVTSKMI